MRSFLFVVILIASLNALDFRVGGGTYDTKLKILNFIDHDTSYDTKVFYLSLPKSKLSINEKIFYYFDAEYHISDSKREKTQFANIVANYQFPLFGSFNDRLNNMIDMISIDGDYESFGGDFNIGLGYDLLTDKDSYFALAINTGATLPNISAKNISHKIDVAYDMIDKWDMNIYTYKIGPSFRSKYSFNEIFSVFATAGFGFQKVYISSDLFKSDVNTKGRYSSFDISIDINPFQINSNYFSKNLSLTLGHTEKKWSVDSVDVNSYNFFKFDLMQSFDLDLRHSYSYIGLEYKF
ncbi:MAG: hypothetical protein LGB78_01630 [Sulfurovum sp.]|nr:hypothetical protein [Sulfurovum sp.]MCB4764919.1 hypothetical protein [Sulfurovum sp.]